MEEYHIEKIVLRDKDIIRICNWYLSSEIDFEEQGYDDALYERLKEEYKKMTGEELE